MTEQAHEQAVDDLLTLDLEYRLTVAHRSVGESACACAEYLVRRRDVLIPAVLKRASEHGADPVDTFAAFARKVHERHLNGGELS